MERKISWLCRIALHWYQLYPSFLREGDELWVIGVCRCGKIKKLGLAHKEPK